MILKILILSITALTISSSIHSNPRDLNRIKQMDSNENGEISYEEFNASALDRFTLLDTNGDGIVTGEEFMNPILEQFKNMDLNTDAVLSKKEIRKALKKMRKEKKTKMIEEKKQPQPFIKQ
jgi:Ca2+-binding EF-hand superfamily protein